MEQHKTDLKRFERRVRIVRSWRGMAVGASFGALISTVWAGLDWANIAWATWAGLAVVVAAGAVGGLVAGLLQTVSPTVLAESIDRRAALEDRLTTSVERANSVRGFDAELHEDAQFHLHQLRPRQLYPVRLGRWHGVAAGLAVLASCIFLLGNTPILLNDQQRKDREEVHAAGQAVERVLKPIEDHPEIPTQAAEDKRLAEALRRLSKELERSRLTKEEAMQKANAIQKQAQELVKSRAAAAEQQIAKAESAFEKMERSEMEKAGIQDSDPNLAKMADADRQAKMDALEKESEQNQQRIAQLQKQLSQNAGRTDSEQMQLSKELQELMKSQNEITKQMEQLKLSNNVREMLKRMMANPKYRELLEKAREMQKKLEEAMKEAQKNGQQEKLSHEQIEEMQKQLEQLAKQLKDDKAMTDYLQALIDAMKQGCGT